MAERPCGLRVGRKQILILPAGVYQKPEVARPRKRGLGGKPPVSAAAGWALTEGGPQRIFGYFLCEQKVTPVPIKTKNLSTFLSKSVDKKPEPKQLQEPPRFRFLITWLKEKVRRRRRFPAPAAPGHPAAARAPRSGTGSRNGPRRPLLPGGPASASRPKRRAAPPLPEGRRPS